MKAFGSIVAGTYSSLCASLSHCLPSSSRHEHKTAASDPEKAFNIIDQQPARTTPPAVGYAAAGRSKGAPRKERAPRHRTRSSLSSFSTRRRLLSNASSTTLRRPQISAPTNFQHVQSGSFQFPEFAVAKRTKRRSFRPLELSIYLKDNRLSPILPLFDGPSPPRTPPHKMIPSADSGDSPQSLARSRSYSTLSFHVPRNAISTGSVFESPRSQHSQQSAPSPPTVMRKRAYTSPDPPPGIMEDLVERVAQAMLERDDLQHQINDVIERQSLYSVSRPASPQDMEPMPEVPALPPNAPSFSERVNGDRTPTTPVQPPPPTPLRAHPINSQRLEKRLPPPPLPLRLRPPLRKKKSFSRISHWLAFQGADSKEQQLSLDSVTNFPKPTTDNDGFYEVAPPLVMSSRRSSFDSASSASDWSVEEEQTVPTCWSPASDTTIKAIVDAPTGLGPAPGRGAQRSFQGRTFVFPNVPTQQLRQPAAASPRLVGVAV